MGKTSLSAGNTHKKCLYSAESGVFLVVSAEYRQFFALFANF